MNSPVETDAPHWADPGYFREQSKLANAGRLIWQLVRPPRGHRTMPTKAGMFLILIALGIGTAAFNTSHNILYLVLALLLTSLLLSGVMSWLNFKGCRWRLRSEPHLRAEEPSPVVVEIENLKSWLPTYGLWFRLRAEAEGTQTLLGQEGRLDPRGRESVEWLFTPRRRGLETLRLEGIVSKFPFGFLRKSITDSCFRQVCVWPARVPYRFGGTEMRQAHRQGEWRTRAGAGTELLKVRPYRPGDPLRQVHWKASARQGKMLVREMAEESGAHFVIVVDSTEGRWQADETLEKLCSFAGSLAEDLFVDDLLAGTVVNGSGLVRVRKVSDVHAFLSALAEVKPGRGAPGTSFGGGFLPITFLPEGRGVVSCWLDGERVGEA